MPVRGGENVEQLNFLKEALNKEDTYLYVGRSVFNIIHTVFMQEHHGYRVLRTPSREREIQSYR